MPHELKLAIPLSCNAYCSFKALEEFYLIYNAAMAWNASNSTLRKVCFLFAFSLQNDICFSLWKQRWRAALIFSQSNCIVEANSFVLCSKTHSRCSNLKNFHLYMKCHGQGHLGLECMLMVYAAITLPMIPFMMYPSLIPYESMSIELSEHEW